MFAHKNHMLSLQIILKSYLCRCILLDYISKTNIIFK